MTASVRYPTREELLELQELILASDFPYLPPVDERWVEDMFTMFSLVRMIPDADKDFVLAASHLLFKVIKSHRRADGNKRSSLCCLLFFLFLNKKTYHFTGQELETLALLVASSQGNTENQLIPVIGGIFQRTIS